jgi:hypothetical protein
MSWEIAIRDAKDQIHRAKLRIKELSGPCDFSKGNGWLVRRFLL